MTAVTLKQLHLDLTGIRKELQSLRSLIEEDLAPADDVVADVVESRERPLGQLVPHREVARRHSPPTRELWELRTRASLARLLTGQAASRLPSELVTDRTFRGPSNSTRKRSITSRPMRHSLPGRSRQRTDTSNSWPSKRTRAR